MKTYRTAEIASAVGIHPNTVRLYEKLNLIPKPERLPNGYRVFTEFHVEQCRLVRLAFRVEILQNGLRRKIAEAVRRSAAGDFDGALSEIDGYLAQIRQERSDAEEAIGIVRQTLSLPASEGGRYLSRKEVSEELGLSSDTVRNWEMNGLLIAKRTENGRRVYSADDIRRLKIIRSLRRANYSLTAILRLLGKLSENPQADIRAALNAPDPSDDVLSACDRLIVSLSSAEKNAFRMKAEITRIKKLFF